MISCLLIFGEERQLCSFELLIGYSAHPMREGLVNHARSAPSMASLRRLVLVHQRSGTGGLNIENNVTSQSVRFAPGRGRSSD